MEKQKKVISRIKLDISSAVFFTHLIQNGLATFENDDKLGEDEAYAVITKEDKKTDIKVVAFSLFFCLVAE